VVPQQRRHQPHGRLSARTFVDIDTSIRGTVRFGVGSEFAIEGSGMVVSEGKLGDHL
jgi:hypothetical protein